MENILRDWLSVHSPTLMNIYLLSIVMYQNNLTIISGDNQDKDNKEEDEKIRKCFLKILEQLVVDGKISKFGEAKLICEYGKNSEMLTGFHDIIVSVARNPNLICPDMWSEKNAIIESTNKCFPCKKHSNRRKQRKQRK